MSSIGVEVGTPLDDLEAMNEEFDLGIENEAEEKGADTADDASENSKRPTAKVKIVITGTGTDASSAQSLSGTEGDVVC